MASDKRFPTHQPGWAKATAHLRTGEEGTAIIEFLAIFLAMIVPILFAISIMGDVQRAMMATSSAAREAARVYATAANQQQARQRAAVAYSEMLANYQLPRSRARMQLSATCPPDAGGACHGQFGPGAEITVVVAYNVAIGRIPFVGAGLGPGVTIGATHHTRRDRYRGLG